MELWAWGTSKGTICWMGGLMWACRVLPKRFSHPSSGSTLYFGGPGFTSAWMAPLPNNCLLLQLSNGPAASTGPAMDVPVAMPRCPGQSRNAAGSEPGLTPWPMKQGYWYSVWFCGRPLSRGSNNLKWHREILGFQSLELHAFWR